MCRCGSPLSSAYAQVSFRIRVGACSPEPLINSNKHIRMRKKTYPSPREQWLKCVELADNWVKSVQADANLCPPLPGTHTDEWSTRWDEYRALLHTKLRADTKKTNVELYTSRVWFAAHKDWKRSWVLTDPWYPGIALYNTRHFVKGDFVLLEYTNGLDRHPVWSCTSKGHRLDGYYCETNRSQASGLISIIAPASERVGRPPEMSRPTPWSPRYPEYLKREILPVPDNVWELPPELKDRHPADPDIVNFMVNVRKELLGCHNFACPLLHKQT